MLALDAGRSILVLVDYQAKLMPAIADGERVVAAAGMLAEVAELLGIRVVGTAQNPRALGSNVAPIHARLDACVVKTHFDACVDGLLEVLDAGNAATPQIVIAGCEAHVCLLQTALGLLRAQREVWVVAAACGSRRPSDHRLAMQRLAAAGAQIVSPEMVCFEWLHDCRHPQFKAVLERVKRMPLDGPDPHRDPCPACDGTTRAVQTC